jgi:hypothetical protein
MPKTTLGKWSLVLIIVMPILLLVGSSFADNLYASVPAGDTILKDISARPALALTMLAGFFCGIGAFITGLLTILKEKERAVLVIISTIIGALVIGFLILEIAFPH